jgi:RNA-binding protein YhbY
MDTHAMPVLVRIGKAGLTAQILEEIRKHLKKRGAIKVKFLPAHAKGKDKRKFAAELAEKTNSRIAQQVGFVVVLQRQNLNTASASAGEKEGEDDDG